MELMLFAMLLQPPLDAWRYERAQPRVQWGKIAAPVRRWAWVTFRAWWRCDVAERIILANVTRDKLELARERIKREAKMDLTGDAGEVQRDGFEATYAYNEAAAELTLILTRKPFYVPVRTIRSRVLGAVKDFGIHERKQS